MLKGSLAVVWALLMLATSPAIAQSITYTGANTISGRGNGPDENYQIFITTDGTVGPLSSSNITDYQIFLSDTNNQIWLTPLNSTFSYSNGFSATANDLFFDFTNGGDALFELNNGQGIPAGTVFFCFAGGVSCSGFVNGEVSWDRNSYGGSQAAYNYLTGNVVVASNATPGSVPEPSTWSLLLIGFGMLGGMFRRSATRLRAKAALDPSVAVR